MKLYFDELHTQVGKLSLYDVTAITTWCKELDKNKETCRSTTSKVQDGGIQDQVNGEVDLTHTVDDTMILFSPLLHGDDHDYDLTKEAIYDSGRESSEDGEHGIFPSPMEALESIEPTTIGLNDDMVTIPCENESHLVHLSESSSEMSDSTICEIECFYFEDMSDTPSEMREELIGQVRSFGFLTTYPLP
jgi:hypothetical protein